jgi:hypothetical protein
MDETQLRVDGNAAAGVLRTVFVDELTTARGVCAGCVAIAQTGSQHVYMQMISPGGVLRCKPVKECPRYSFRLTGDIGWYAGLQVHRGARVSRGAPNAVRHHAGVGPGDETRHLEHCMGIAGPVTKSPFCRPTSA